MKKSINNFKLNYECFGAGQIILLLHGWGGSLESLRKLGKLISRENFKVYIIDLPGFGKSDKPKKALSLDNYAQIIEEFCHELEIRSLSIFGHSFGGSIAVKLAVRENLKIDKLILCNSSGIRNNKKSYSQKLLRFSKKIKFLPIIKHFYPYLRKFFYYYIIRNRDYINYPDLVETYKKVIAEDLTSDLEKVKVPTLIFWGGMDKSTPIEHAQTFHKSIKNSKLKIFKKEGHGLPKFKPELLYRDIIKFIKK